MRRNRNFIGPAGMGGMVRLWGASSGIKNVQYGTITVNGGTATITEVVVANSILFFLGNDCGDASGAAYGFSSLVFTSPTVITFSTGANSNVGSFCVLEFVPGFIKSAGSGTVTMTGVGSATVTIPSVNTSKTFVTYIGHGSNDGTSTAQWGRLALTNSTTITASRQLASNTTNVRYSYLEFY